MSRSGCSALHEGMEWIPLKKKRSPLWLWQNRSRKQTQIKMGISHTFLSLLLILAKTEDIHHQKFPMAKTRIVHSRLTATLMTIRQEILLFLLLQSFQIILILMTQASLQPSFPELILNSKISVWLPRWLRNQKCSWFL